MLNDPIINEVRQAREELLKKADYDLKILIKMLRENEKKSNAKVVSRIKKIDGTLLEIEK